MKALYILLLTLALALTSCEKPDPAPVPQPEQPEQEGKEEEKDEEKEEYEIKKGDMFIIPEYVFHSFEYHEDTYLVAMYNNGVELDENTKDIWNK